MIPFLILVAIFIPAVLATLWALYGIATRTDS